MNLHPDSAEKIVLAAVALHNFIMVNGSAATYNPENYVDWEHSNHIMHAGNWRTEVEALPSTRLGSNNLSRDAFALRNNLKNYLCNEGAVSFQFNRRDK